MTYPDIRHRQAASITMAGRVAGLKRLLGVLLLVFGAVWLALTLAGVKLW
jgi:hypothetical protein